MCSCHPWCTQRRCSRQRGSVVVSVSSCWCWCLMMLAMMNTMSASCSRASMLNVVAVMITARDVSYVFIVVCISLVIVDIIVGALLTSVNITHCCCHFSHNCRRYFECEVHCYRKYCHCYCDQGVLLLMASSSLLSFCGTSY